jgi:hypothetical protein
MAPTQAAIRNQLDKDDASLTFPFSRERGQGIKEKLEAAKNGEFALAIDIVTKDSPKHAHAIAQVWAYFRVWLFVDDVDDENECIASSKVRCSTCSICL